MISTIPNISNIVITKSPFISPSVKIKLLQASHKSPTPSGGGIVFVIVGTLGSCYFKFFIPLICLPLSIIGLVDDKIKESDYRFENGTKPQLLNETE